TVIALAVSASVPSGSSCGVAVPEPAVVPLRAVIVPVVLTTIVASAKLSACSRVTRPRCLARDISSRIIRRSISAVSRLAFSGCSITLGVSYFGRQAELVEVPELIDVLRRGRVIDRRVPGRELAACTIEVLRRRNG